jgi:hypothetical protein
MTVGRSWRTPAKHDLMRQLIGKEVGVVGSKADIARSVWYDLTAGDAAPVDDQPWEQSCSPGILAHHATNSKKPVVVILYEIKPNTFSRLVANLAERLPTMGYARGDDGLWLFGEHVRFHAICASGSDADIRGVQRGDAVFAFNDPNAITEWAMRPTFAAEIQSRTWLFRSLTTMGCNPAGLKRLDYDEHRAGWFDLIQAQERAQPPHRDLLLAAIRRDDAQWAYLMSEPTKWKPAMEVTARSSFKRFGMDVDTAWWRTEPEAFEALKRQLFLTNAERKAV